MWGEVGVRVCVLGLLDVEDRKPSMLVVGLRPCHDPGRPWTVRIEGLGVSSA